MEKYEYTYTFYFAEKENPNLLDISALFYDIDLAYDLSLVIADKNYQNYDANSRWFYYRNRKINKKDKIKTIKIIKNSPLELVVSMTTGFAVLWAFTQIVEKWATLDIDISNKLLEKRKKELEIEKLELEIQEKKKAIDLPPNEMAVIESRRSELEHTENSILNRLHNNPLKLEKIKID